jgi:hypothetical protein
MRCWLDRQPVPDYRQKDLADPILPARPGQRSLNDVYGRQTIPTPDELMVITLSDVIK